MSIMQMLFAGGGGSSRFANLTRLGQDAQGTGGATISATGLTAKAGRYVIVLGYISNPGSTSLTIGGAAPNYISSTSSQPFIAYSNITGTDGSVTCSGATSYNHIAAFTVEVSGSFSSSNITYTNTSTATRPDGGFLLVASFGDGGSFSFTHGADSFVDFGQQVTLVGGSYTGVAGMRSDIDTGGGGSMTASLSPGLNYIAVIT